MATQTIRQQATLAVPVDTEIVWKKMGYLFLVIALAVRPYFGSLHAKPLDERSWADLDKATMATRLP